MKEEEIPDKNIFMMCDALNKRALSDLSGEFTVRHCRRNELSIWKAFPFDDEETAKGYESFMTSFFNETYRNDQELFFEKTLFVCDERDQPVATCMIWKA